MSSIYRFVPSGRQVALSGIVFVVSQSIIAALLHRGGAEHTLIALQLCFDADQFAGLLAGLSEGQLQALRLHFWPDMLHPVWYSIFAWLLTRWLFAQYRLDSWCGLLWLAPVMGGLDLAENLLHIPLIYGWSEPAPLNVALAAVFASGKWLLAAAFTLLNLGLLAGLKFRDRNGA